MKHKELKIELLTHHQDKIKLFSKAHKLEFISLKELKEFGQVDKLEQAELMKSSFSPIELEACYQLNHAKYNRKRRLKSYIEKMMESFENVYFLTLTFSEKYNNSSDETKRKYVMRCLRKLTPYYVANVDYGKQFGRLHYHAIATEPLTQEQWKYGFINCQKIRHNSTDIEKVAKYTTKFTNHALKDTNKTQKCLYSKSLRDLEV